MDLNQTYVYTSPHAIAWTHFSKGELWVNLTTWQYDVPFREVFLVIVERQQVQFIEQKKANNNLIAHFGNTFDVLSYIGIWIPA